MKDLSIIIVNWKVADLVVQNLKSILKYTDNLDYEVIVVDNNSNDGIEDLLKKNFLKELNNGKILFIQSAVNLGFSKGNNLGIKHSSGRFLLFMNPDMELKENTFKKLLDYYHSVDDEKKALFTCKLLFPDASVQKNIKRNPGFLDQALILLKLHHFLYKYWPLKDYFALDFDYSKSQKVEQLMGAFILVDRNLMIDELGSWNEIYWIWWEDVDLCKTAQEKGYNNYYYADTAVIHYEGKSFAKELSLKKQRWFISSMLKYFRLHLKFYEYWKLLILYILVPISYFLTILVQLFKIKSRGQAKIISK